MRIDDLMIEDEYKKCLPELSSEEYTNLEKSIVKSGIHSPIIIWKGVVIDGHNRYAICKAHHIEEVPVKEMTFDSKEDAIGWILSNQLSRRNLSDYQRNVIALRYKEIVQQKMKERQIASGKEYGIGVDQKNHTYTDKTSTRRELAKLAGTNEASIQRAEIILSKGTEEQRERAMRGGKGNSQSAIVREINEKEEPQKICCKCGKIFPVSKMVKAGGSSDSYSYSCKECEKKRREKSRSKKIDAHMSNTIERIKSGETTPYTRENVYEELKYAADGLVASWRAIITEHIDLVSQDETIVADAIEYLQSQFKEDEINVNF